VAYVGVFDDGAGISAQEHDLVHQCSVVEVDVVSDLPVGVHQLFVHFELDFVAFEQFFEEREGFFSTARAFCGRGDADQRAS